MEKIKAWVVENPKKAWIIGGAVVVILLLAIFGDPTGVSDGVVNQIGKD